MHRNNVLLVFSGLKENRRVRQQIMRHRLTLNSLCCQFHKPKQIPFVAVCAIIRLLHVSTKAAFNISRFCTFCHKVSQLSNNLSNFKQVLSVIDDVFTLLASSVYLTRNLS